MDKLSQTQEALCDFIIRASKEDAPVHTVQVLPEAVKALVALSTSIRV